METPFRMQESYNIFAGGKGNAPGQNVGILPVEF
jgi:hypothetical protein